MEAEPSRSVSAPLPTTAAPVDDAPAVPDPTVEALADVLHGAIHEGRPCPWQPITDCPYYRREATPYATQLAPILAEHTERAVREALEAAAVRVEAAGLGADFGRQYDGNESPDAALHHAYDEGLQEAARVVREGGRP